MLYMCVHTCGGQGLARISFPIALCLSFCFVLRQGRPSFLAVLELSMQTRLAWTYRDPPTFAYGVQGLKAYCLFICLFFETGSNFVDPAVLELTILTRLASNSQNPYVSVSQMLPCLLLETETHVAQAGLKFTMQLRLTLNSWFSCLHLPCAGIIGVPWHPSWNQIFKIKYCP